MLESALGGKADDFQRIADVPPLMPGLVGKVDDRSAVPKGPTTLHTSGRAASSRIRKRTFCLSFTLANSESLTSRLLKSRSMTDV